MSSDESDLTPESIKLDALGIVHNLLPEKSKEKYLKAYNDFDKWKSAKSVSESVLLVYFQHLSSTKKSSLLYVRASPAKKAARMGLPHVTSFCWCLGLEMGAKIIAYTHLFISLSLVVLCSVYAHNFHKLVGTVEDAGDRVYSTWYKIAVSVAVVSTGHVLLAATLLYGVYKRNTVSLRLWLWVMSLLLVVALLANVAGMAAFGLTSSGSDIFLAFLEGLLFFSLVAYCILCVNSYYLMVKRCQDMEGPARTDY